MEKKFISNTEFFKLSKEDDSQYVGLMVAMDSELELLNSMEDFKFIGQMGSKYRGVQPSAYSYTAKNGRKINLVVAKSGIGKVNAALTANFIHESAYPDCIISTGVCGSISQDFINQGDVILATEVRYHDVWCGEPNEYGQIQGLPASFKCPLATTNLLERILEVYDGSVYRVPILSGDYFADGIKCNEISKKFFQPEYRHSGIDMESGAIAQVCHLTGMDFISVRIVSDCPLSTLSVQRNYEDFWTRAPKNLTTIIKTVLDVNAEEENGN